VLEVPIGESKLEGRSARASSTVALSRHCRSCQQVHRSPPTLSAERLRSATPKMESGTALSGDAPPHFGVAPPCGPHGWVDSCRGRGSCCCALVYMTMSQAVIFPACLGPLHRDWPRKRPTERPHKAPSWARIGLGSFFRFFIFELILKITIFANNPLGLIRINLPSSSGDFYMNSPASFKAFLINPFSLQKSL
jgi:hypothetical protein